jgi:hypothetical protein
MTRVLFNMGEATFVRTTKWSKIIRLLQMGDYFLSVMGTMQNFRELVKCIGSHLTLLRWLRTILCFVNN